jgi:hypothetical protein
MLQFHLTSPSRSSVSVEIPPALQADRVAAPGDGGVSSAKVKKGCAACGLR